MLIHLKEENMIRTPIWRTKIALCVGHVSAIHVRHIKLIQIFWILLPIDHAFGHVDILSQKAFESDLVYGTPSCNKKKPYTILDRSLLNCIHLLPISVRQLRTDSILNIPFNCRFIEMNMQLHMSRYCLLSITMVIHRYYPDSITCAISRQWKLLTRMGEWMTNMS